jgi:membrane protein DedA with SNARE-associated domain
VSGAALASIFSVAASIGLPLIFLFVMIETGCGIPFAPGELAVLTGAIAAADHKLSIVAVIAVGAAGAIVGDNIGYLIGRNGGRRLLESDRGPFVDQRRGALRFGDPFFERHGAKAVFYGRWLPILRVFASWLAGGAKMRWTSFAFWNAAGGICWATSVGLLGYFGGSAAKAIVNGVSSYGAIAVIAGLILITLLYRLRRRRATATTADPAAPGQPTAAFGSSPRGSSEALTAPVEPPT